ncbi:hypothetical protein KAR91_27010 [Candidatus Pacearchaeota archaeon]|nr:hypothetical protein [Candidatus Pacearchaeota archaeon]
MHFSEAIEVMVAGGSVRIAAWGPDVFISIQTPDAGSKMTAPYFYVTSRFGMVPWIPTMIEMLTQVWDEV